MIILRRLERACAAPWTAAALLPLSPASPAGDGHPKRHFSRHALTLLLFVILHSSFLIPAAAAVPSLLNHQGRIAVNGTNFEGTGDFKFALVDANGTTTYWSNDGTSTAGSQPTAAVSLTVTKGLYAVLLGDTALANMTAVPATVFDNADVRLRVWFNDGANGFQQITPDQRLAASPFALNAAKAESVPDASVTNAKLTNSSITVNTGTGLSGGGGIALGSSITLSNAGVLSLTGGGGITVSNSTGNITLGSSATSANTASAIIARDASGNFSAGTITAALNGNASTATTAGSATSFTGSLAGDVTGTQSATAIAATTVTGKALTGFASTTGTITAADTILSAINKLNGNVGLRAPLASPTFTGTVSGTFSGNGAALTNLSGANISAGTVGSTQITDLSIVNADVSNTAAIAYSKLSLAGSIVNADISASAAIADSKLATISTAGKVANSATTGTSANTPNTLVLRDGSGGFSAGTINGTFVGNGSGLTNVTATTVQLANVIAPPVKPVVAWGKNSSGQTTLPTMANVAAVAAGSFHSIALLKDGTVVQWGSIAASPGTAVSVTHIAAGSGHNLARKSDGTVIAWGDNTFGQTTVPGGITTAANVAAGEKHSLVLKADGTLVAWGDNTFGQTTIPGTATNVTAIACGADHNLALKADGTVVAWGRNDVGQITVPGGLANVVAIAAGAYHSLAVKSDGTVVAWGWDSGGQVAGATGLTGISKVAGGYAFSLALKTDGTVVAWGDNTDGQTTIPSTATQVAQIAAGASHALALRADFIPAQVARLDQDNVFTGNVGIKRTAAANALEVEGTASKTTAGNWLANSDRRIKTEIRPVTGALEKLGRVRLVDFKYTDDYRAEHPGIEDKRYLNVIAQDFAEVFPDDVKSSGERLPDGSDKILQVDTYPLTIYSAAAVQELARENARLKKQLADQEERLRKIEAALGK